MAAAGWADEFGKKPVGQKVGIFVGIGAALGALYYVAVFKDLRTKLDAARAQAVQLANDERKLVADEKEYEELKVQLVELQAEIAANNEALPTASELPAFFDTLNRKVGEAGVEVRRWDYQKEVPVEEFYKVPVEIEVVGTFYELKRFFYLLYKLNQTEIVAAADLGPAVTDPGAPGVPAPVEEKNRVLTIESLVLDRPMVLNNELVLSATFRASTFRQDPPQAAEPDKGKPPKAAGAGNAKAGGAATGPGDARAPGGLPGEAKQKTEAAMDKSEDRAAGGKGAGKLKEGL
jgi:type IV pilus assembly protein PilO